MTARQALSNRLWDMQKKKKKKFQQMVLDLEELIHSLEGRHVNKYTIIVIVTE